MAQSPDKTRIGPPSTILEPSGVVWSLRSDLNVMRATSATAVPIAVNGKASEMKWAGGFVYSHSPTVPNHWFKVVSVSNKGTVTWVDVGVNDPVPASIPPPAQAVVTFNAASMNAGSPITVTLAGGAGNLQDWLTIAPVGSLPNVYAQGQGVGWQYAPTPAVEWTTTLPTAPGVYEARYLLNNLYVVAAKSAPFTVVVPYAEPVKSFPNPLGLAVGVPTSLAPYVAVTLPIVWDVVDTPQVSVTADGKITAKVAGTSSVTSAITDAH